MLGKMLKYDIKDYSKSMLPICLMLLIMSIITRIFYTISESFEGLKATFSILFGISTFIFCITIIISLVYCFFISVKNYYKKVLKDEGYLTHTLPVRKSTIILSQIISSIIWLFIICIIILATLAIAYYQKGMISSFINIMNSEMSSELIVSPIVTLIIIVIMMICSYIATVLAIYCSMTIGHGFSNNKMGYSIIAGVIFYAVYQVLGIISVVGVLACNYGSLETMINGIAMTENILIQLIVAAFATNIIIGIASYILTNYNLKKRLNLE